MNCIRVQHFLVSFLEGEVTPEEGALVQQHLAECPTCERELAALAATRSAVSQALDSLAAGSVPTPQAWDHLQARLAKEAQPWSLKPPEWLHHVIASVQGTLVSRSLRQSRVAKVLVPALSVTMVLVVAVVLWLRTTAQVSAQQILERALQAQAQAQPVSGVRHLRIESYSSDPFLPGQAATASIVENYFDLQTHNVRLVEFDSATGQVVFAMSRDGTYVYSGWRDGSSEPNDLTTIYREPQSASIVIDQVPPGLVIDESLWLEALRREPNVEFDQETWPNGRQVYTLRSKSVNLAAGGAVDEELIGGRCVLVIDAQTYQVLEYRTTILRDGQEVVVSSSRYLVDEVLPVVSAVAWDLSDLQGIQIVEGAPPGNTGLQRDLISRQELASRTQFAYVLKSIPDGFREEIWASRQLASEPSNYVVAYGNTVGDYLALDPWDGARHLTELMDDTYVTASSLKLFFMPEGTSDLAGQPFTEAFVQTPDGDFFLLKSSLSREQVQVLAEELVPVR